MDWLIGFTAGACGVVVSHPFDTIKTALQTRKPIEMKPSVLYRGIGPAIIGVGWEKSVVFSTYHIAKSKVKTKSVELDNFLSGGFSGLCASLVVTPTERLKILYQTGTKPELNQLTPKYLYKGFVPTASREIPGFAIYFTVFEYLKAGRKLDMPQAFVYGAISGMSSWVFIYPQDTIKTICQASNSEQKIKLLDLAKGLMNRNIYRGFSYVALRVIPLHGTALMVMDRLKSIHQK